MICLRLAHPDPPEEFGQRSVRVVVSADEFLECLFYLLALFIAWETPFWLSIWDANRSLSNNETFKRRFPWLYLKEYLSTLENSETFLKCSSVAFRKRTAAVA